MTVGLLSGVARGRALPKLAVTMLMSAMLALAGCGGGDDDTAAAQTSTNPSGQVTISGTPATQVVQGAAYSFTPTAAGPSGSTLTFAITNKPAWAQFNATTGRLNGTPTNAQVGMYSNIGISVTDGTNTASLAAFNIAVVGTATGSALLTWTPPTQNTDGSAMTGATALTGYKVYWGTQQGNYPNSAPVGANVASYMVEQLTPATYYFVVTAVSAAGESSYSNVASKVVQ
jgi:hypothetical protein